MYTNRLKFIYRTIDIGNGKHFCYTTENAFRNHGILPWIPPSYNGDDPRTYYGYTNSQHPYGFGCMCERAACKYNAVLCNPNTHTTDCVAWSILALMPLPPPLAPLRESQIYCVHCHAAICDRCIFHARFLFFSPAKSRRDGRQNRWRSARIWNPPFEGSQWLLMTFHFFAYN